MYKQKIIYQRNILFSFYVALTLVAGVCSFLFFFSLFYHVLWASQTETFPKKEKRYTIQLDQIKRTVSKQVVENINENKKKPLIHKFLSDQNSQSASRNISSKKQSDVALNKKSPLTSFDAKKGTVGGEQFEKSFLVSSSSQETVFGKKVDVQKKSGTQGTNGKTTFNSYNSQAITSSSERYSTNFSLSTYKWEWAPYIRIIKERIHRYISPPPAFYMGMLRGQTTFVVSISRNGELLSFKVIKHYGNKPLQKTTEDVMLAVFQLPPLPRDFPEGQLTLTGSIYYQIR